MKSIIDCLPPEEIETITRVGVAFLLLHRLEKQICHCLVIVFPRRPLKTVDDLEQLTAAEQSKTLGQLVHALRQRTTVQPMLGSILKSFLEDRNRFIHHLSDQIGDISTATGRKAICDFIDGFSNNIGVLMRIFAAFLLAYLQQLKLSDIYEHSDSAADNQFIDEVKSLVPLLDFFVAANEQPQS